MKVPTAMKAVKKAAPGDVFRLMAYPHLGLGLKKGSCYRAKYLRSLCKGDQGKLKKLEEKMKDPSFFRPGGHVSLVANGPRAKYIVFNGLKDKEKTSSGLTKKDLVKNKHG